MKTLSCRPLSLVVGFTLVMSLLVLVPPTPASAAEPPVVDNPTGAVTADALPTAQINGVAWDQVVVGDTVYVAGQFTSARPAGSAAGRNESPRQNLMSYNLRTGVMTSWAPQVNGRIRVITASPDGSRIYIGGTFTAVNGVTRSRVAAFNTADGSLVAGFAPSVSSDVFAVTVSGSAVYLGGWFTAVNNVARTRLAAVSPVNGSLLAWAPTADYTVYGLGLTSAQDRVVAAGSFQRLNNLTSVSMGTLDAVTGASYPFVAGTKLRNILDNAAMFSLKVIGRKAYSTGFGYGSGNFEGALIADAYTGVIDNMLDCHGDTYDSVPMNGIVYSVHHHHTCDNAGGYPEESPRRWLYSDAFTADARGTVAANNQPGAGYGNWEGQPAGSMVNWFPLFTAGKASGASQAAWTVETAGSYLVQGGEFLTVNGTGQQGLVRFATRDVVTSPRMGPEGSAAELIPTLFQRTSTSVGGSFRTSWDRDNALLTYRVYRSDLGTATPVATLTGMSTFWSRPSLSFVDSTVVPGRSYTYYVVVADPDGNSRQGQSAQITPAPSDIDTGYPAQVMTDQPAHYWRLAQLAGASSSPDQVSASALTLLSSATGGAAGALNGVSNTATTFNGTVSGRAATAVAESAPQVFTLELWFKTTSTAGGKLLGFGSSSTGTSASYDRHLYLDASGRLTFGVYPGAVRTVTTPGTYRDGAWHHAVATLSGQGMNLYVDGALRASSTQATSAQAMSGYWRLGGDALAGSWPNRGTSENVAATLDEVAVYPVELDATRVAAHYAAATTQQPANQLPVADFAATVAGQEVSVDASASSDPDGSIVSYAWEYGDGSTGTGRTSSHRYASAGSYTVRLTVVDDRGGTRSLARVVQVGAVDGQTVARDAFARTQSRWGTAPVGGAWTDSGAANYATDGTRGVITLPRAGSGPSAQLASVSERDVSVVTDVALSTMPAGGAVLHQVLARTSGSSSYKAVVRVEPTGALRLYVARVVNGAETVLNTTTLASFGYSAGERLKIRLDVTGSAPTTVTARLWRAAQSEPTAPLVTATDATAALQSAGGLSVTSYASSSITNAPVVITVDDFFATRPAEAGGNRAPTAAFTVAATDLGIAVDGTGSADAEGPISSYTWAFGDGSTASGATAQHTYASAGTYTIRLTVTDAAAATGTTTRSVTVTSPAAVHARDAFARTVGSGWGSAEVGGAWTANVGSAFSVDGSAGLANLTTAGSTRTMRLDGVSARDTVITTEIALDKVPVGDSYYHQLLARMNGSSLYSLTTRVTPTGALHLVLAKIDNGSETQLQTFPLGTFGYGPGESIRIKFGATGGSPTTLGGKVWRVGTAEPTGYQIAAVDNVAGLQSAGAVGMKFYSAGSTSNMPQLVRVESFEARSQ